MNDEGSGAVVCDNFLQVLYRIRLYTLFINPLLSVGVVSVRKFSSFQDLSVELSNDNRSIM